MRIHFSLRGVERFLVTGLLFVAIAVVCAADEPSGVPLRRVVLFNSGVGFFERLADVEGNVQLELKFKTDDVNDLLQSMVLQDFGGGTIAPVTYASKEPLTRTLETFRIDLAGEPSLADLLAQIRGERVRVETPEPAEGVIVGVERNEERIDDRTVEVKTLNLLTADGLASIRLNNVRRIKLLNEKLDEELRRALEILAADQAVEKKQVTLSFQGDGKRKVRVAYIQESPIWKTSYRLVLRQGEKPFLQGWAIVDNTTEEDWDDVSLTLVSGRPISFVMDLYQSLFVYRPKVQPELFAGLRPQTHDQDLAASDAEFRAKLASSTFGGEQGRSRMSGMGGMGGGGMASGMLAGGADSPAPAPLDPSQGVTSAASAGDVGELFQYVIKIPVTLARQKSAMLPIVNETVAAEKVSLYSPQAHRRHPLNALELTNLTALHLMQGPITVFDDNVYAGNARILDLPPGGKRLVSYALDLETEISDESVPSLEQLVSVRIAKGVALVTHEQRRKHKYIVKNSGDAAKRVLIEQPIDAQWKLESPQTPAEKTRSIYRFSVEAEPGKPAELTVEEKRTTREDVAVRDLGDRVELLLKANFVSEPVKQALTEVSQRQQALADLIAKREIVEKQVREITAEQARIRANLSEVDKSSELYGRYLRKLTTQEDELESLNQQAKALEKDASKKRADLGELILGLNGE
ncbi:MAG TPA: hypothetical protein VFI31_13660 [Pirellulales bacterium]|nr:hypothetical protein [Pirellulales bacterium]